MMPQQPVPIAQKWLDRGLVWVHLGNGLFWTKEQGWLPPAAIAGTPKRTGGPFGIATGFGTNAGTGTSDRLTGPVLKSSLGFRSIFTTFYAFSRGGGDFGRIFNGNGQTGIGANIEALFVNGGATLELTYTCTDSSQQGQWWLLNATGAGTELSKWNSYGITHDHRVINSPPLFFKNGARGTTSQQSPTNSLYISTSVALDIGSRSTDTARTFDGLIGPLYIFDHPGSGLTDNEHAELHADPSIIFAKPPERFFQALASGFNRWLAAYSNVVIKK
jgi:hypothetical protein